ncbi:unnamed protein product [Parascedosporium putredinis]|uniref:Major facilitator superfamily (MFS) profile domain-containing protein n=1 Tax=Parascedosporium putredinis TaxID=1442378 RepID=A0A9P1H1B3_9PEZI|nr:unnamed protein product [Parascedosporium putredinis]CAI7992580.1 unnamed protein product [Parascedosporium putredinis]
MSSSPKGADPGLSTASPIREGRTTFRQDRRCILICFLVSLASLQYGLDLGVINSAQAMKGFLKVFGHPNPKAPNGYGIAPSFQQSITAMMNVGVILGSLSLETFAHYLGRRRDFLAAAVFCVGANTILIVSTNKGAVIFGRLLFGFSNGLFLGFTNIYISEAAPSHLRGALISFQQLSVCIGTVIASVVNNRTKALESRLSYQIPLFTLYGVPVFCFILAFCIPESPRWLVLRNRDDEAITHLARLRGSQYPREVVEAELKQIKVAVEVERELSVSRWAAMRLMFSDAELRRTLLTIAAGTMHGASGFPFIANYKTYFFQVSGSKDAFIDSIIVTTLSISVLMLVIGIVWTTIPGTPTSGKIIVAMIVIYQCFYSAAAGPTVFVVAGEIPNNRLRAMTYGLGNGIGFIANFLIALTTPYFINPEALNIGAKDYECVGFEDHRAAEEKAAVIEEERNVVSPASLRESASKA